MKLQELFNEQFNFNNAAGVVDLMRNAGQSVPTLGRSTTWGSSAGNAGGNTGNSGNTGGNTGSVMSDFTNGNIVTPQAGGYVSSHPPKSGALINNPGNVKFSSTTSRYPGIAGKKGQFCVFKAPEFGIAASMKRLSVYRANTLFDALNIYAPASDGNNPKQYASVVQSRTGVNPYVMINLKDPETLKKIIPGMLWMECNAQYSQDVINKAAEIYQSMSAMS